MDKTEKEDEINADKYEKKLNNMILPQNIQSSLEKPEPAEKLFNNRRKNAEHDLVSSLNVLEDSGTDNFPSPLVVRKSLGPNAEIEVKTPKSPASVAWSPRKFLTEQSVSEDDNTDKTHVGIKKRFTQERMNRFVNSDSDDDSGRMHRFSKLKKRKKRKSKKTSDSD